MGYYLQQTVDGDLDDVADEVEAALADEGFGILSEIDVAATLEKKLGIEDFQDYRILGACNPPLAHQGLEAETDLGVLLPCNVIVYESDDEIVVSAVDPEVMLSVIDNPNLDAIATDVRERFERVLETLA
jgi:uncharacterized protein (DUF302 family)